ncbi:TPA: hypothetical protein QDA82_001065 [Burkholderia vietnamiensis]|nr:hypothetical protein [Burkholderia vietnamiensis]HEF4838943.1 hypothetical protein [Burkholderia vietnamiensis]
MTTNKSRSDALTDLLKSIVTNLNAGLPGIALTRAETALELHAASPVEQPEKSLAPEGGSEARGRWIQANCPTGDIIESPSPSNNREFPTSMSESDCEHRIALAPSQLAAVKPAQADAQVGLTDEQRDVLTWAIGRANAQGEDACADVLRSILAAHEGAAS